MTLRSRYRPKHPELDPFLMSEIGEDANGLTLTVQSAIARSDLDPYEEADRLRKLPREAALGAMGRVVAALPPGSWSELDAREVAAGLLDRLPRSASEAESTMSTGSAPKADAKPRLTATRLLLIAGFVALAAFMVWGMPEEKADYMDLSDARIAAQNMTFAGSLIGVAPGQLRSAEGRAAHDAI